MDRTQASDIELAISEDREIAAKKAYKTLLEAKKDVDAQLKIEHEHLSNKGMIEWLRKDVQKNSWKIETVKKKIAELDEFLERHQKLTFRKRIIRKRLLGLDITDEIEKILYHKLTKEWRNIYSELKDMNEVIADAKNGKERNLKLVKALENYENDMLNMIKECEVDYVSDPNLKKSSVDINAKVKAAEEEVFAALENRIAEHNKKTGKRYPKKRSLLDDESDDDGPKIPKYDDM